MSEDSTSDCRICRKQCGDFYVPDEWHEALRGDAQQVSTLCNQVRALLRQEATE